MASTSSTAAAPTLSLASLPGPRPTPTSLLDLPQPWLLQLAQCSALDKHSTTLVALFRTCTLFRDAVLRHRTAVASFSVPIAHEDFSAEVERLCTVARRSSSVKLQLMGSWGDETGSPTPWTETEPCITHLLVCAMEELGGERPLACVKEIELEDLEQTSLVPAWVKVLCPNATKLDLGLSTLADPPLRQPLPHPHLQQLQWDRQSDLYDDPPLEEHMRQQLAALPSLTSLTLADLAWAQEEEEEEDDDDEEEGQQQAGRLMSCSVTRLELHALPEHASALQGLWTQFPCLRELSLDSATLDDDGLEALLQGVPATMDRLSAGGFRLQRSHAHAAWPWPEVTVKELDVDSFARLPLDGIPACSWQSVVPSSDAAAVARVAAAVKRWGGRWSGPGVWWISGSDFKALLAALGPLVAALPAALQGRLRIRGLHDVTAERVQQLGQHLPASITTLTLTASCMAPDAWPAVLPSLPAGVTTLRLVHVYRLTEEQVLALCQAAVRPVTVVVRRQGRGHPLALREAELQDIRGRLAGAGLVTLEGRDE